MPRGGYDCSGAAPGSFASREARQIFSSRGGPTPRASNAAVFHGTMPPPHVPPMLAAPQGLVSAPPIGGAPNGMMGYGFPGAAAPHAGYMQQQQPGTYMVAGAGAGQPPMHAMANYTFPPSTIQIPGGAAASAATGGPPNPNSMYLHGAYPVPQQAAHYGAGPGPAPGQAPYYRQQ